MNTFDDEWTPAHDLALLYSGLACVDRDLADEEISALQELMAEWVPLTADTTPGAVVQDAAQALKQSRKSVREAAHRIGRKMSTDERRELLRDLLRVAQADGVVLGPERELLHHLATAWDLKQIRAHDGETPEVDLERRGEDWTVLHELAFLFVQVGQGAEDGATADMLGPMAARLQEWAPEASDEVLRATMLRALEAFGDRDEEPLMRDSVEGLKDALPPVQRLLVLSDLLAIAPLDGPSGDTMRDRLHTLAEAWNIPIRLGTG